MAPNQQDVLSDYLTDMLGVPSKTEPKETGSIQDNEVVEDEEASLENEMLDLEESSHQVGISDDQITSESSEVSACDEVEEATKYLNTFLSEVAESSEGESSAAESNVSVAVKEKLDNVVLPPSLSDELNKLSHQIDAHKQLACLFDLVSKPINALTQGERSLVVMELLDLMKTIPESRLKDYIRDQYDAVVG
jgi:hypothetical protein